MIRVGVIGVGRWGRNIVRTLGTNPAVQIQWTTSRTARVGPSALPPHLIDWRRALDRADVDAVFVATPASTHREIACEVLARGLPLFIEKPLALSVADTEEIDTVWQAAARRYPTPPPLLVDHVYLFHPAYEKLYELTRLFGYEPVEIEATFGGPGPRHLDCPARWDWGPHAISAILDLGGVARASTAWTGSGSLPTRHASIFCQTACGVFILNDTGLPERKLLHEIGESIAPVPYEAEEPLTRSITHFLRAVAGDALALGDRRMGIRLALEVAREIEAAEGST